MVRVCASIAQVFDEFLVAVDGGGEVMRLNPRRCSASLRDTKVQPMACAYLRMRDWTVLCSPGFIARNVELPKCHRGFYLDNFGPKTELLPVSMSIFVRPILPKQAKNRYAVGKNQEDLSV